MLGHETHSFSPMATTLETFESSMTLAGQYEGGASPLDAPLEIARARADELRWEVFQGLMTFASPGGPAPKEVYEVLRQRLLADLRAVMPIDIVALMLHGAMVADGYDNCEGDLLAHVREIVGEDAVVGAVLDSHAHLGPAMVANADLLIATKEYPHTDFRERSEELLELCARALVGRVKPTSSVFDCRMIDKYHTPREPMRSFVDKLERLERENDDVLSISLIHSFPWSDTPVMGSRVLVITDDARDKGERLAEELGRELFALRGQLAEPWLPLDEALAQADAAPPGPVVLADAADNPGGGAPCDATFILRALVDGSRTDVAIGRFYDPTSVAAIITAGEGSSLRVAIGGRLSDLSGEPVELDVEVMKILRAGEAGAGDAAPMPGDVAWIRSGSIDLIIGDFQGQTFFTSEFERFGIDLAAKRLIVVKSSQHFYDSFAQLTASILYVDTPAVLTQDVTALPYRRVTRPKWPFDPDPFDER